MLEVVSESPVGPLSLAEAKAHLRIDHALDDAELGQMLASVLAEAQGVANRSIADRTLRLTLDGFPKTRRYIHLPAGPVQTIVAIIYVDTAGETVTLDAARYRAGPKAGAGLVTPARGYSWPATYDDEGSVTIEYVAGGAAPITAVDATSNTLTISGRTLAVGDRVTLWTDDALPAPLVASRAYWVVDVDGQTIQLATTEDGDAINLTDVGDGQSFLGNDFGSFEMFRSALKLLVGHRYENREEVTSGFGTVREMTRGAARLLEQLRFGDDFD